MMMRSRIQGRRYAGRAAWRLWLTHQASAPSATITQVAAAKSIGD